MYKYHEKEASNVSLRLIIGRAGMGKTQLCLQEIAQNLQQRQQGPLILLVPEQATFYMEKMLLEASGKGGTIQAQVLSFQRLAWRVLQETGGNLYPPLNDIGKNLVIGRLLELNKKKLSAFSRVMDKPGFLDVVKEGISELKSYNIPPEMMEEVLENFVDTNGQLKGKIQDLALIYREFEGFMDQQYQDPQDQLDILAQRISSSIFIRDCQIWMDGFHGFTPKEYSVMRQLLLTAKGVNISLCLDKSHLQKKLLDTDTFFPLWETYEQIINMAREINCSTEITHLDSLGSRRYSRSPELSYLEESFVHQLEPYNEEITSLKLAETANRRVELETTAREIITLCREKGYRYQDIGVLVRDLTPYEDLVRTVYSSYEIPYFLDKKRPLRYHPLLDLLGGALEVVEKDWNYDGIFRYLKTDLVSISRQEVDLLENYCLAYGIRGKRWVDGEPWTFIRRNSLDENSFEFQLTDEEEKELRRINRVRSKAISALVNLEKGMKDAKRASSLVRVLYQLLVDLSVGHKLEYWSQQALEKGLLEEAQLHIQVWNKVLELLDQLVEVMGDQEMGLAHFNQLIKSGLDSMELGLIPPGLDQVVVGSLDRSRNPNLKAVFVLGVNDGVFPARCPDEGLLSDEDRRTLSTYNISLAPTTEKRLFAEQFLVYLAMTRASEFLWVSYPQADEEGKALRPSILISYLEKIFAGNQNERYMQVYTEEPMEKDMGSFLVHPGPSLSYLVTNLREAIRGKEIDPQWWHVYNWYVQGKEWHEPLKKAVSGLFADSLDDSLHSLKAKELYGRTLRTSISRLEKFKACPFSHFLSYGLKLKEREEYKLRAPDLGQFFHAALEAVHQNLRVAQRDLGDLSSQETLELVEGVVDKTIPRLQNELLLSTARYRYMTRKLKRIVLRAVKILREHEKRGTFRPLGVEISFGKDGNLPGLQFTLNDGTQVVLQGRIDRVDGAKGEQGYFLRVIDYKSGTPSLSLLEIYYGLKLQLLAYLDVVLTNASHLVQGEVLPGGILYFKIQDPFISAKGPLSPGELEKVILKESKMKGYLLNEPQVIKLMDKDISGHSELIPAALNKEGQLYKNSDSVFTMEEFNSLRNYVENTLQNIGQEIIDGNVAVQPYRFKGKSPCRFCLYHAVCRFDAGIPGHSYKLLLPKEREEIWYEIGRGEKSHG